MLVHSALLPDSTDTSAPNAGVPVAPCPPLGSGVWNYRIGVSDERELVEMEGVLVRFIL